MPLIRRIYRAIYVDALPASYFDEADLQIEHALFAAGCFWGVEDLFRQEFAENGLLDLRCVYAGDKDHADPIDTHLGDHAEAILIKFDRSKLSYRDLVLHFFRIHDPTQRNGQGNDRGRRYRSCIWTFSKEQEKIAKQLRTRIDLHYKTKVDGSTCSTKILQVDQDFIWPAERRHQRYLARHPNGYHCHCHYKRSHILSEHDGTF